MLHDNYITVGMANVFIHIEIEDYTIQPMPLKVLEGLLHVPSDMIVLQDEFLITCHSTSDTARQEAQTDGRGHAPRPTRPFCPPALTACSTPKTDVSVFVDRNGIMSRDYTIRWTTAPASIGLFLSYAHHSQRPC